MTMKILMLCNKSPYPAKEGGPIAMSMLIDGLTKAGHSVKVLAISSNKYKVDLNKVPAAFMQKTKMETAYIDLSIKPIPAFLNLFTKKSYHVERFISNAFRNKLIQILQNEHFDIVQLETLFIAPYLETIRTYSNAKVVLRAHNIEHLIWKRVCETTTNVVKKLYLKHIWATLKNYETRTVGAFDGIAAITSRDAAFFRNLVGNKIPVTDIPYGVVPVLEKMDEPFECTVPSLFHIGSMDWIPNQEGIKWFLDQVWPKVHNEFPGLKLYLAGRNMPAWLTDQVWPDVEVIGEVPDARAFILSKQIMVVPLLSGSGIRIKIIEAMAEGKAVITTPVGAEGIECEHGKHILFATQPEEFLDAIRRCVENDVFCTDLGTNARFLIHEYHDRDKLISKLVGFYNKL
jgi:glycosyltransferase involved in cell wall biosynthesis